MKILVADDEIGQGGSAPDRLVARLRGIGHEVSGASTSWEAQELVQKEGWDIAIFDLRWQTEGDAEGRIGWELVKAIRSTEKNEDAQVIIYSGYLDPEIEKRAIEERVIAVPKMRPGGPAPLESEHLSSMLTTIRALGWLMKAPGRKVFSLETYEKLRESIEKFFKDGERNCADYEKNVFLMTRFQKGNKTLEQIDGTIRKALADRALVGHRADDRCYTSDRNLWDNVCAYMFGCKYGLAVLEDILRDEFNPNVALEYGFMRALGRPTLLLKEKRFAPRADILGTLWEEFDILDLEKTVTEAIHRWLDDLGIPRK